MTSRLRTLTFSNLLGRKWNIDAKNLTIHESEPLGVGSFGQVFKGTLKVGVRSYTVAVKKRLPTVTNDEMVEEAEKMKNFNHQNVLKIYGICEMGPDVHLVMEIMTDNLEKHLRKYKLPTEILLEIVQQIVDGLIYLETKRYTHRDIASRNILINYYGAAVHAKIADFGLCRVLANDGTHTRNEFSNTLRNYSVAPEAFELQQYTVKSDVWSLGIVLWEIFSGGKVPYQAWADSLGKKFSQAAQMMVAMIRRIKNGDRMDCPKHNMKCPKRDCLLYSVLTDCWNLDPARRPSYTDVKIIFSQNIDI